MMQYIPVILILFVAGCDIGQRDRLAHEYQMECLRLHGTMSPWTGYCTLPK